jgi:threonyl-tRNA synthetase
VTSGIIGEQHGRAAEAVAVRGGMDEITVTFADGAARRFRAGVTVGEVLAAMGQADGAAIAAVVDDRVVDLSRPLDHDCRLRPLPAATADGLDVLRHSTAHLMAQAVKRLFPSAQVTIGPTIEGGFYYDFKFERAFTPEDLGRIEAVMREIVAADFPVERLEMPREEAAAFFRRLGEDYKVEIIEGLPDERVSLYRQGEFTDLCRGPHVPSTGRITAFKLTGVAGAYWRGDERNEMLQRIYGTAFPTEAELQEYLTLLEEVKLRDHRRLGRELDLFSTSEKVGPGLVLWHPKGARVRHLIESFWRERHFAGGYDLVYSPHVGRASLWETSGHLDFYRDNMYAAIEVEGQAYYVKPMNCPFHIEVYRSRLRSYRDLPLRFAELGSVYRYERSGVLHGLMRVRGFTQDDAHIFCRPDQVAEEIGRVLDFSLDMLRAFGFDRFALYLSTQPKEKSVGAPAQWRVAEDALRRALEERGLDFAVDEGGGAFYGPKIDLKIRDALGRAWQCGTIQFDFNMPARFGLAYRGDDGGEHQPFMVHRALLGSIERFFGVLLEHYGGAFPLWLAPVQARVIPVGERFAAYADEVCGALQGAGLRAERDTSNEKLGYKIRAAQLEKIPYMLVVGEREEKARTVAARQRTGESLPPMSIDEFIGRLAAEARPVAGGAV